MVVRCLAFVVVQALMRPRVNAGAICSTGAASSALTPPVLFRLSLLRARGLLCVRRAEQKTLSNRWLVYPFAFRPSASVCSGADSYIRETGKAECQPFVWARVVKRGRHRTL